MNSPAVEEISTLYEAFFERSDEVADYSFRLFRDARIDFVHKADADYDALCSHVSTFTFLLVARVLRKSCFYCVVCVCFFLFLFLLHRRL